MNEKSICLLLGQEQTLWVKKGGKFFLVIVHFKKCKFYSKFYEDLFIGSGEIAKINVSMHIYHF